MLSRLQIPEQWFDIAVRINDLAASYMKKELEHRLKLSHRKIFELYERAFKDICMVRGGYLLKGAWVPLLQFALLSIVSRDAGRHVGSHTYGKKKATRVTRLFGWVGSAVLLSDR